MHARGVVPDEERLAVALGLVHEVAGRLDQHLVEGRHVVLRLQERQVVHVRHVRHVGERRQRAFIDDPLLADFAPARHLGRIVGVGRIAVDQAARAVLVVVVLVDRERVPVRIGHRVEVVQISEELIEAVHGREILVQVAEMVLAELPGGIALCLQSGGERHGLCRDANVGPRLADGRQPRADRQLAGNEVRPARRAACFGVIVGEHHAFRSQLVEVRRLPRHDSAMVCADVEPADIVAHDDKDVGRPLLLLLCRCRYDRHRCLPYSLH